MPIAEALKDVAVKTCDADCAGVLVAVNDALQDLRVHPVCDCGEPHHVAEQHRDLAPFACNRGYRPGYLELFGLGQRLQYSLAGPERQAKFLQIVLGQNQVLRTGFSKGRNSAIALIYSMATAG